MKMNRYVSSVLDEIKRTTPWETEFIQAVTEVLSSIDIVVERDPRYESNSILERLVVPERVISFKVSWQDDEGKLHINNGYRVQFNSALGPYKGGIRFHPSVTLSGLKFLGFEQIFKNSLTGLPIGGGKGGSDFSPNGRSESEIRRFCQAFMTELSRHIGPNTDVPAGDIGVGAREIGYMYGQYKLLKNRTEGVLTGKGLDWGGSLLRPQATGFGNVYFAREMLKTRGEELAGKTVAISGFGNVAWGSATKASELGAKVVTLSGPDGYIYDPDGVSGEKLDYMEEMKLTGHDKVEDYAKKFGVEFFPGKKPWERKVDIALPCAIQNELDREDAEMLVENGCICVSEGANMPCVPEAVELFLEKGLLFGPGKAANAGGVATSGLEMSQNSQRLSWTREQVDKKLKAIMVKIHDDIQETSKEFALEGNYVVGANITGFRKVADTMIALGIL